MIVTNTENQELTIENKIDKVFDMEHCEGILCPIKDILAHLGDKWSIFTILALGQNKVARFNELKKQVNGISQRMLTVTLRSLEENGLVSRQIYPEIPPRVEYALTSLGHSLLGQMLQLAEWATSHRDEIEEARQNFKEKKLVF
ncbi:helix-turn-helix transcriptional regulator [Chitinophaga horti]|uniref:Helix-turn-helix transcriptional regulator n=1 Tax=Chitinophaga horti TaxID=2920382 RepID=A0ABY6IY85_9BACT|nr:helix-turn-helix domain-containing protein [Chitinophaga horti]UYQ92233.1 helix-turn-helix transcriptional regulator [Chitinophaga horti]